MRKTKSPKSGKRFRQKWRTSSRSEMMLVRHWNRRDGSGRKLEPGVRRKLWRRKITECSILTFNNESRITVFTSFTIGRVIQQPRCAAATGEKRLNHMHYITCGEVRLLGKK